MRTHSQSVENSLQHIRPLIFTCFSRARYFPSFPSSSSHSKILPILTLSQVMDSQESTSMKYDDGFDHWVNPFRMPSRRALREAAGRTKTPPITSSPRSVGLQNGTPSKQDANVGANTFEVTSPTQRTKASQSKNLQISSIPSTTHPQNCVASKQDMDLGPKRLIMPSLTQRTAGRLSLVIPPPLPQGMLGPQNRPSSKSNEGIRSSQFQRPSRAEGEEASPLKAPPIPSREGLLGPQNRTPKSLDGDLDPIRFEIPSRAQRKKARQPRNVPVLPPPPRRRPHNRFDVLRPNPFRVPSRGQREAVFKAAERLRVLEPRTTSLFVDLPAEIRLIIYEYALTSQSPITPRLNGAQNAESKEAQADAGESSAQANASTLALLQTCRLVNGEARPVYYASNTFRFTSAKDLHDFLQHIGPDLLNELRKLHIEGLPTFKPFPEQFLERLRREGLPDRVYQKLSSKRRAILGDDANNAALMLQQCKRLHRIHLTMGSRDEMCHILWLRRMTGYCTTVLDLVDDGHWALRPSESVGSTSEWFHVLAMALKDPESRRALFPDLEKGQQRRIDVDLDMNRKMKELQSGIVSMAI